MRHIGLAAVPILLLSACAPTLHRTAPARPDALQCTRVHLQSLGYTVSSAGRKVRARRTVEQEWVYRVDHVIEASFEPTTSQFTVKGARIETKTPGKDQPSTPGRVLQPTHQRLEPDPTLVAVLDEVVGTCTDRSAMPTSDQDIQLHP